MSRVIKFRVWDGMRYAPNYEPIMVNIHLWDYTHSPNPQWQWEMKGLVFEQFTGLVDKNGQDIYEGDILQSHNVSWSPRAVVVYNDYEARFAPCEIEEYLIDKRDGNLFNQSGEPWMLFACEVIGNIHEDAELLA